MANNGVRLRVLLDTSFLLPTLGIDAGKMANRVLKRLSETEVSAYYSRFSLLESLWVATRSIRVSTFDLDRFNFGLRSITESGRYNTVDENHEVFNKAAGMYKLGHLDMIDNLLYASSVVFELKLLTLDTGLKDFIEENALDNTLLFPQAFV